jgi:hypothetical protein
MKSVTYRRSTIFNRVILTGGFVLVSILLIMAGLNEDEAIFNGIHYLLAGIVGVPYFGRYFILYMILLLKNKTIVSYDDYTIKVKNREFSLHEVQKVSMTRSFPVGFLWIHTPAYMILTFTREKLYIPTYYAMTKKDEREVYDILKHIISNKKKVAKVTANFSQEK